MSEDMRYLSQRIGASFARCIHTGANIARERLHVVWDFRFDTPDTYQIRTGYTNQDQGFNYDRGPLRFMLSATSNLENQLHVGYTP